MTFGGLYMVRTKLLREELEYYRNHLFRAPE